MFELVKNVFCSLAVLSLSLLAARAHAQPSSDDGKPHANIPRPPVAIVNNQLPNLLRVHERVFSGGLPEDDAAFEELATLGVKTIISVDGMTPDTAMARKYGLRYVHLPHGYNGIPKDRVVELAKAVRDLEGPIYIHCHHGKHRSPAAASVACVAAGLIPADRSVSILRLAGTNPNYRGLYAAARNATALDSRLLNELQIEFKEVEDIPAIADAMVHLDINHEHLKQIAESSWKTPLNHPDLDPAHEALLMRELYTELLRSEEVAEMPHDFHKWLHDSEAAAMQLELELQKWHSANDGATPPAKLAELAHRISENCRACHLKYRDVPLGE